MSKPILKWVGGKTQILNDVLNRFPREMNNYHEPFIGGGSVLIELLNKIEKKEIIVHGNLYAYDINKDLIFLYNNIQNKVLELYNELKYIINQYNSTNNNNIKIKKGEIVTEHTYKTNKEFFYYWIRQLYNKEKNRDSIKCSAYFIFLNKTCFRGVYRVGPNGFNVPYGNYKSPSIINKEHLLHISKLIKNVKFINLDFSESLKNIKSNDFVYLDPPYIKVEKNSFVSYTKEKFDTLEHDKLFTILKNNKFLFLMSNSNSPIIREIFNNNNYFFTIINCKRSINSKNPNSKTDEVLISNKNISIT
jgi:DNA adenine methylase